MVTPSVAVQLIPSGGNGMSGHPSEKDKVEQV